MSDPVLAARWAEMNAQRKYRRLAPSTLRAAWWALHAVRRARRDLRTVGVGATVAVPPGLPWGSRGGVYGVLQRLDPTCIERSLVLQTWLAAHGVARDVVVGVQTGGQDRVKAHAWLDGLTHPAEFASYTEIHRIPAHTPDVP